MKLSDLVQQGPDPKSKLEDIFAEEPVDLTTFIQDKKYLASPELSLVQFDAVRHAEQILFPETYDLMVEEWGDIWKPVRYVNLLTLEWGKGSGKDHICRVISLRCAYMLLCLHDPLKYYGFPSQDTIHFLNVARSASQANRAFFKPMTRAVSRGWFKQWAEPTTGVIQYGRGVSPNIEAVSGHSDAESQEGLNLLVGVADEIDAFPTKAEAQQRRGMEARDPAGSAEAIVDMMRSSSTTRFPQTYKNCYISYPRYKGSMIQRLRKKAVQSIENLGEKSIHYVSGPLPTWEVNPLRKRSDFDTDYEEDPVLADAKYGCKPSGAVNPFFRNEEAVRFAFRDERPQQPVTINYELVNKIAPETGREVKLWQPRFSFSQEFYPIEGARYALHGDIAISKDRAGVAMSHVKDWIEVEREVLDEEGSPSIVVELQPIVVNDFCASFEADLKAKPQREVVIAWYRDLLNELLKLGFMVRRFTFDGFQSTDSMQWLEGIGIESERVSTDMNNDVWDTLRNLIYSGRYEAPHRETVLDELLALSKLPNGRVDHPPFGSKDEADALGASALGAVLVGGREGEERKQSYPDHEVSEVMAFTEMPLDLEDLTDYYRHILT